MVHSLPHPPEESNQPEEGAAPEDEQRRRKLREELLAFLEKLKPWCGRFETLDEWWEFLRPFDRWLEGAKDDLTPEQYRRLKRYVQWTEQGREALKLACKSLSRELAAIAEELALTAASAGTGTAATAVVGGTGLGGWAWVLIAVVATAVLFWGGRRAWQALQPTTGAVVEIHSQGCDPVAPPDLSPEVREGFRILGVTLPQEPLTEDRPWRFQLPAQIRTMEILRTPTTLDVTVGVAGGVTWTWSLPWEDDNSQWTWEGQPIEPGHPVVIPLEPGQTVQINVRCPSP